MQVLSLELEIANGVFMLLLPMAKPVIGARWSENLRIGAYADPLSEFTESTWKASSVGIDHTQTLESSDPVNRKFEIQSTAIQEIDPRCEMGVGIKRPVHI